MPRQPSWRYIQRESEEPELDNILQTDFDGDMPMLEVPDVDDLPPESIVDSESSSGMEQDDELEEDDLDGDYTMQDQRASESEDVGEMPQAKLKGKAKATTKPKVCFIVDIVLFILSSLISNLS